MSYQWKVLTLGLVTAPRISTALTQPILFLCNHKDFHIIYLDEILIMVCSFLCSLLVHLRLHINFSKSDHDINQTIFFGGEGLCWDTVHMSVSFPHDKFADIQQLALSLLQTQPVTVCWVMSFLGNANFSVNGHFQLWRLCHVIQSYMLTNCYPPHPSVSSFHFSFSSFHQLE